MDFGYLKEALDRLVSEGSAPGVDCSVYVDHNEVFRYFTGLSDVKNNVKIKGDELYIIFSMTKMLTCVSALQLFEKGAFKLDDLLSKYMPEFETMYVSCEPYTGEDTEVQRGMTLEAEIKAGSVFKAENHVTIRQLFTMTAGFDYILNEESIVKSISEGKTSTYDIARALSETVLGFEPGTRYRYSLCHDILGALIEIWSGMKLGDYMKKYIFEPLGMKDTFFGVPCDEKRLSRLAKLYEKIGKGKFNEIPRICRFNLTEEHESGGAGLISSTDDYATFLDALAVGGVGKTGKRILEASTVELMRANQLDETQLKDFELTRPGYGYGFGVRTHLTPEKSNSPSPIGEFGWGGAAGAFSLVDPSKKLSLTYFQHVHNWEWELEKTLRDALYKSIT